MGQHLGQPAHRIPKYLKMPTEGLVTSSSPPTWTYTNSLIPPPTMPSSSALAPGLCFQSFNFSKTQLKGCLFHWDFSEFSSVEWFLLLGSLEVFLQISDMVLLSWFAIYSCYINGLFILVTQEITWSFLTHPRRLRWNLAQSLGCSGVQLNLTTGCAPYTGTLRVFWISLEMLFHPLEDRIHPCSLCGSEWCFFMKKII